jgi:hypothetical protein
MAIIAPKLRKDTSAISCKRLSTSWMADQVSLTVKPIPWPFVKMKESMSAEKVCGLCVALLEVPSTPSSVGIFQPNEGAEDSEKWTINGVKRGNLVIIFLRALTAIRQ